MIAFGYVSNSGEIQVYSIGETADEVKETVMSWRSAHSERYSRDESWNRILENGSIQKLSISIASGEDAC